MGFLRRALHTGTPVTSGPEARTSSKKARTAERERVVAERERAAAERELLARWSADDGRERRLATSRP